MPEHAWINHERIDVMTLKEILKAFKAAPKIGSANDNPEGTRYIQISETLLNEIIKSLENFLDLSGQYGDH